MTGGPVRARPGGHPAKRRRTGEIGSHWCSPTQNAAPGAEVLNCRLVYALIPNSLLEDIVDERVRKIALRDLDRVAHSMVLEAQGTGTADIEERIREYIRDTLKERDIWNEP
jgi:hypothetical protein